MKSGGENKGRGMTIIVKRFIGIRDKVAMGEGRTRDQE